MNNLDNTTTESNQKHHRSFQKSNMRMIKLFINNRIERVLLGRHINPQHCSFLPILNQVVVVSEVDDDVLCYAKPLVTATDEKGYKILTMSRAEANEVNNSDTETVMSATDSNIPIGATRGLTFFECSMTQPNVRQKYREYRAAQPKMEENNNASKAAHQNVRRAKNDRLTNKRPRLFIRYGDRESGQWKIDTGYRSKLRRKTLIRASL